MKARRFIVYILFALISMLILCSSGIRANNIRIIGTPEVKKKTNAVAAITFTIAWDNSWKSSKPANWDAAWIYVKCWDGDQWNHAYLEETGHTPGNKSLAEYRVHNKDKTMKKCPMSISVGHSMVYKKWHINPTEVAVKGVAGVFLYRSDSLGAGDVMVPGVSLLWDYSKQGFVADDDLVVKVFAVEMVYVPTEAYFLGGKGTEAYNYNSFTCKGKTFGFPLNVTGEAAITIANNATATTLFSTVGMPAGVLVAAYPKGYQAFYIMKYELTQEAYCDFLNTLNQGQQNARRGDGVAQLDAIAVGGTSWSGGVNELSPWRYYIEVSQRAPTVQFGVDASNNNVWNETIKVTNASGDTCSLSIDGQDLAVNFVSMYDLLAYADFAGLRPMTELEYEKACRGGRAVINDEYAWGSSTLTYANKSHHTAAGSWFSYNTTTILNTNRGDERMPVGYNAGAAHGGTHATNWWSWYTWNYSAPIRVGCFADSTTTRQAAGATYWGVMNMSDNVSELCISAGSTGAGPGRLFEGVHGDGQLPADGNADVTGWKIDATPAYYIPRGMVFPTHGCGWGCGYTFNTYRAGDYVTGQDLDAGRTSSRAQADHGSVGTTREHVSFMPGIRCVRTVNAAK